jgi:hypothetical protein
MTKLEFFRSYLDNQVLDLIRLISPRFIAKQMTLNLGCVAEKQRANVQQLVNIFGQDTQTHLILYCINNLNDIEKVPEVGKK